MRRMERSVEGKGGVRKGGVPRLAFFFPSFPIRSSSFIYSLIYFNSASQSLKSISHSLKKEKNLFTKICISSDFSPHRQSKTLLPLLQIAQQRQHLSRQQIIIQCHQIHYHLLEEHLLVKHM